MNGIKLPPGVAELIKPGTVTIATDSIECFLDWSVAFAGDPDTNVVLVDYRDNPPPEGITTVVIPESRFRR